MGPDLVRAAEEAVRQATRALDGRADLLCVFVNGTDAQEVERAARHAMAFSDARTVLGCSADGVIAAGRGVEEPSAVSAWAAILPGARLEPFRLETLQAEDRLVVVGMPENTPEDVVGVLLADPYSFPVDAFVERSEEVLPGLPLVGGLAGGGQGETRLFVDDQIVESGAVGLIIGGPVNAITLLSQGARPIGPPMTVTSAEQNVLLELAGVPALDKLEEIIADLSVPERELATQGLLIGIAMDEYAEEHEQGDFLVRGVVGVDADTGALAVGDMVETGQTVRFQVRDAGAADSNLTKVVRAFDVGRSKAPCCSPATAGAAPCSAAPTTMCRPSTGSAPSAASSPTARSDPSEGATTSTASPPPSSPSQDPTTGRTAPYERRARSSRRHRWHQDGRGHHRPRRAGRVL